MSCPVCGGPELAFSIPPAASEYLPDDRPGATICRRCLSVSPSDDPPADYPDFTVIDEAFPADGEAAAVVASLFALVDSLALYRAEIEALATLAERRGVDVLLLLDRLVANDAIRPHFDADRRRAQLEQLLS